MVIICLIALLLLIWFRTDAWLEYTKLLRLNAMSDYKGYEAAKRDDVMLTYNNFLRQKHDCFAIRLVTCPICQAVWWGIGFGLLTHFYLAPIYIMFGLILFLVTDKLLG
jgi:hypothetical protein